MVFDCSIPILNVVLCSSSLGIPDISVVILFIGVTSCFGIPKSFGLNSVKNLSSSSSSSYNFLKLL